MLTVKETVDEFDIKTILCHPDIYDTITDDNCVPSHKFNPTINKDYLYVGGYCKGDIIALMVYHKYNDGNECHVQVLPEHRKEHAKKFGEQSLLFRGTLPLYAEIPALYKNVFSFALKNRFRVIKTKDDGYIKNGVKHLVNVLRYEE